MNCQLYYHLQQEAYVANLKGEIKEQERKQAEMLKHSQDCLICNGQIADPMVEQLFGGLVIVTREQ